MNNFFYNSKFFYFFFQIFQIPLLSLHNIAPSPRPPTGQVLSLQNRYAAASPLRLTGPVLSLQVFP